MPSYTSAQRGQITQFVAFTSSKESIAAKVRDWRLPKVRVTRLIFPEVSKE
jgi:hypothetical protein